MVAANHCAWFKALYGNASLTQLDLVQNIQSILSSLYDVGQSMPIEYRIDLGRPFAAVTRTGGTLYLMLFQVSVPATRVGLLPFPKLTKFLGHYPLYETDSLATCQRQGYGVLQP